MSENAPLIKSLSHIEVRVDFIVHILGLALALFGGGLLLGLAVEREILSLTFAIVIYVLGLTLMLGFSLVHNCFPAKSDIFERLDQAGIFLMIAASYTPFTTHALHGAWAIGMTLAIWLLALVGIFGKLLFAHKGNLVWVGLYLAMGWLSLIAIKPLIAALPLASIILLAIGGLVYTIGVGFYLFEKLRFRRAIWHIHVITAAGLHYAAIMTGVFTF